MYISSVMFVIVIALGLVPMALAESVTRYIPQGLQSVDVPVRSAAFSTTQDLARATSSPVVIFTQGGRFRVWLAGNTPVALNGSKGYLVSCPSSRLVTFTGARWGASILRVSIPQGIELVVNHRPDSFTSLEAFRRSAGLNVVTRFVRGVPQLEALAGASLGSGFRTFEFARSYGLVASTTIPSVVLPNTNQSPVARTTSFPLSARVGTRMGLTEHSTDSDDDSDVLTHTWRIVSVDPEMLVTRGSSVELTFTQSGEHTLELETSDGLLSHPTRAWVNVIEARSGVQEFTLDGAEHDIGSFGIHGTLPAVSDRLQDGVVLNPRSPVYRIAWDQSIIPAKQFSSVGELLGSARTIDLSAISRLWTPYPEPTWPPRPPAWPAPFTAAVDMGNTTTGVWDSDVLTEIPISSALTVSFFNFTLLKSAGATKTVGQSIQRVLNTRLLPRLQRIVPVSLLNRLSNQAGYHIIEEEDDALLDDDRPVVLNLHGYDFRSEFCGVGELFLASQQRWDGFFGRLPMSPHAVGRNIPTLKKDFKFCRAVYPTTRSVQEIAQGLRQELERTLFANGKERKLIIIGYSMGGLVARFLRNEFIRGVRIGERVEWLVTIGTPHHGAGISTALERGLFNHLLEEFIYTSFIESMSPFLAFGCVPPSRGLKSLAYDATVHDAQGNRVDPTLNTTLTQFNASEDFYRNSTNVITIAGGTSGPALPNRQLEIARKQFEYGTLAPQGFSDGIVSTQSSLPRDLFGMRASGGSTDPFFGKRANGSIDRRAFFDGLDHYQLMTDVELICRLHTWLSSLVNNNHPPTDTTPDEIDIMADVGSESVSRPTTTLTIAGAGAIDEDGDSVTHHWSFVRTIPSADVRLINTESSTPSVITSRATNVLVWHTVRDGRGGITAKIVDIFIPDLRVPSLCSIGRYIASLREYFDGSFVWSRGIVGCLEQDKAKYTRWQDITDDTTIVKPADVTQADKWWRRTIYLYYRGPTINRGPIAFSNVAIARTDSVVQIPQ